MNGRIYDPTLGRFLQADPFIQAPSNSQSYNRYSYVLNNPLSYTDPSGYFLSKLWKAVKPIVGVVVVAVVSAYCASCGAYFAGSWYGAATAGAIAGGITAGVNGGNILRGAFTGALSGAAFYGVGSAFGGVDTSFGSAGYYGKVAAHGVTGGVMSVLQGGKFGHGFAAAGVTQTFAKGIDGLSKARFSIKRVTAAAIVGGTASKLSGGKFANGAVTGAFSRMFNDEAHFQKEKSYWERTWEKAKNWFKEVDVYGGFVVRGVASPLWDGELKPFMVDAYAGLTFDSDLVYADSGLVSGLDAEIGGILGGSYKADGYGLSLGRGAEVGITWVDANALAASQTFNIDTPLGGITFITSSNVDALHGILIGGPSIGLSFSATTSEGSGAIGKIIKERRE